MEYIGQKMSNQKLRKIDLLGSQHKYCRSCTAQRHMCTCFRRHNKQGQCPGCRSPYRMHSFDCWPYLRQCCCMDLRNLPSSTKELYHSILAQPRSHKCFDHCRIQQILHRGNCMSTSRNQPAGHCCKGSQCHWGRSWQQF